MTNYFCSNYKFVEGFWGTPQQMYAGDFGSPGRLQSFSEQKLNAVLCGIARRVVPEQTMDGNQIHPRPCSGHRLELDNMHGGIAGWHVA